MRHISCDHCTKDLTPGTDARYTVHIDARLVCDVAPVAAIAEDDETDTDHIEVMDELLSDQPEDDTVDETDELPLPVAPLSRSYDLCGRCYRKFAANPIGRTPYRSTAFSAN